ncbi:MAG: InlB B-repeat-containing protein, partial [Clostridiales bacterium]|nr:InlB B-repeat-containing protein [Clostridiales bacterium]
MFTKTRTTKAFTALLAAVMMFVFVAFPLAACGNLNGARPTLYTVTFDTDGGSEVAAQRIEAGGLANRPDDPKKAGYSFDGWYKDYDRAEVWNFSYDTVDSDTTLYAKWTEKIGVVVYTVTFDSNGGSAVAAQSVEAGDKAIKPVDPTRAGYEFDGWYKDNGHKTAWNFATDKVNGNVTLYAKWTEKQNVVVYTVTFDTDGGSAVVAQDVEAG